MSSAQVLMGIGALAYLSSRLAGKRRGTAVSAIVAVAGALIVVAGMLRGGQSGFLRETDIAIIAAWLGVAAILYSLGSTPDRPADAKSCSLMMLMLGGVVGVVLEKDIFSMYLAFEVMSISSYALVTYNGDRRSPAEAGVKYLVTNATGTMLAALGVALLFASSGTLDMTKLASLGMKADNLVNTAAMILIVAGFGVKAAIVPMHTWLPDAYAAAPFATSAVLAGIVTPAGLLAMVRVLSSTFAEEHHLLGLVLVTASVAAMLVGNLTALVQTDVKRMLAYSSVAQVGYMLAGFGIGFAYQSATGLEGALFHLVTNAFMKSTAFLAAGILVKAAGTTDMRRLAGVGRKEWWAGAAFTIACLSLAGVPPFAGFMSKMIIYRSGFEAGAPLGYFTSVLCVFSSVLSLGYYLPAIFRVFNTGPAGLGVAAGERKGFLTSRAAIYVPTALLAVFVLVLGFYPGIPLEHAAGLVGNVLKSMAP